MARCCLANITTVYEIFSFSTTSSQLAVFYEITADCSIVCCLCEVVDGEDFTRFDAADDESEQNLRDDDTLAQLNEEFTQHYSG